MEIAEKGIDLAIEENPAIESGAIIYKGELRRFTQRDQSGRRGLDY